MFRGDETGEAVGHEEVPTHVDGRKRVGPLAEGDGEDVRMSTEAMELAVQQNCASKT